MSGVNAFDSAPSEVRSDARVWDEWLRLFANRDEVADRYAEALLDSNPGIQWSEFNAAIVRRWSLAGLRYIKTKAWRLHAERSREAASTAAEDRSAGRGA